MSTPSNVDSKYLLLMLQMCKNLTKLELPSLTRLDFGVLKSAIASLSLKSINITGTIRFISKISDELKAQT
jgi:hypothetical protein